jgi:shikimate dehydrogenase
VRRLYNAFVPHEPGSSINAATRCCAVFGHPIHHSASPAMHNAGFRALGWNARYLAFDVRPEDLQSALEGARCMQFLGVNLTVPHKLLALPLMTELDESAVKWGAVNTVCHEGRNEEGEWLPLREFHDERPMDIRSRGHNTDADGLSRALATDVGFDMEQARVLLLGAGGVGRVAALLMAELGVAELFLVNRTVAKAESLAAEIRERAPEVAVRVGYPDHEMDLIINSTSLGLHREDPLPIDLDQFPLTDTKAVYDMVYRPAETHLMQRAIESGARAVNGLGMLLYQGTRAFEIWTGKTAPVAVMRAALEEEVYGQH